MLFLLPLLLSINLASASPSKSAIKDHYIYGGIEAADGDYPWQMSLEWSPDRFLYFHICGAVLISENYALTAAHCIEGEDRQNLRLLYGSATREWSDSIYISKMTMHEWYDPLDIKHDIAILLLDGVIIPDDLVAPIELPEEGDDHVGENCTITGWGYSEDSNGGIENVLRQLPIPVISNVECNIMMAACDCNAVVGAGEICVYDDTNVGGSCQGDSGGPLSCAHGDSVHLAGITSWGLSDSVGCLQTYPSVYTRVSDYLGWILLQITDAE